MNLGHSYPPWAPTTETNSNEIQQNSCKAIISMFKEYNRNYELFNIPPSKAIKTITFSKAIKTITFLDLVLNYLYNIICITGKY